MEYFIFKVFSKNKKAPAVRGFFHLITHQKSYFLLFKFGNFDLLNLPHSKSSRYSKYLVI